MKIHLISGMALALAGMLVLQACSGIGPTPSPTALPTTTVTSTPDPCSAEMLPEEVQAIHRLTREFDDASVLAINTARDQMSSAIAGLQSIRREAEDLVVPNCLKSLKELQLVQMNTFIQTLVAFMSGADQETVNQGIALSRQLHDQYMLEMTRKLGTGALAQPFTLPTSIGTPGPTPEGTLTPTPGIPIVSNPGPSGINLRSTPSLEAQSVGILAVGQSTLALGQTGDGLWINVEIPGLVGQTAWVFSALVQLSGPGPLQVINVTQ